MRDATCVALFLTAFLTALFGGTLAEVRVVVTEVTGQGTIRRGVLNTADCGDTDRCTELIGQAALVVPPPYRPVPGRPVYHIRADDTASAPGAKLDLVTAVRRWAAYQASRGSSPGIHRDRP